MKRALQKTALALGLCATLPVMADSVDAPQVIHEFGGAWNIYTPPVWEPGQQKVVGTTGAGGAAYVENDAYGIPGFDVTIESGRLYSLSVSGDGYADQSMDNKAVPAGVGATSLLVTSEGTVVGGVTASTYEEPDTNKIKQAGTLFVVGEDQAVTDYRPADALISGGFAVRGQLSADSNGNVYFPYSNGTAVNPGSGAISQLMRLDSNGQMETVVDFMAYSKQWNNSANQANNYWLSKGHAPVASVWSERDNALYLLDNTTYPGRKPNCSAAPEGLFAPDCADGTEFKGHLIRIRGEALNREGGVQEEDIEILFHFTAATGGDVVAAAGYLPSVIEDGDYLYGISQTVKDETGTSAQGIWRIRKSGLDEGVSVADTFAAAHRFVVDTSASSPHRTNPLPEGDSGILGNQVNAPMVLAADGNIYGTTPYDDSTGHNNQGNGTLWRLVIGTAEDRSDDHLEYVHHFIEGTTGKTPRGLSAGPIRNGKQIIIGATAAGTAGGNGGIFTFEVTPLPGAVTLEASQTEGLQDGDSVTLTWQATRAGECVAQASSMDIADWSGALPSSGSQAVTLVAGTTDYVLRCQAFDGEALEQSVSLVAASVGGRSSGGGGGGSLALLMLPLLSLLVWRRRVR